MASNRQLIHDDQSNVILKTGETLYLSEEMADFHFIFETSKGQYERIPAHKLLLVTASDVFRKMFNRSWKKLDKVEIVDASVDEFKEFLQFFYLRQVKISYGNLAKVMYLGDKYNITKCLSVCEKFIINTLEGDNVIWAYELAIFYNQAHLKKYCETFIEINTKAVLTSGNFLECHQKVLANILKLDSLSCPENEVFEACMNWVKATTKVDQLTREVVQAQLGHVFYEIRFKSMTPLEFATLVPSYGHLLSNDEYGDITQAVAVQGFQPNIFNKNLRTPYENLLCDESEFIHCLRALSQYYSYQPYYIKSIEKTRFSINTPLLLYSFQCCQVSEKINNKYCASNILLSTDITIVQVPNFVHAEEEIVLHNEKGYYQSDERSWIILRRPVLVRPGLRYEIRLKRLPSEQYCTWLLLKSEVRMESNIIVQFHEDPTVENDNVTQGIIKSLKFYRIFNEIV